MVYLESILLSWSIQPGLLSIVFHPLECPPPQFLIYPDYVIQDSGAKFIRKAVTGPAEYQLLVHRETAQKAKAKKDDEEELAFLPSHI